MSRELPPWQAYDPSTSRPPSLGGGGGGSRGGAVVVLLATPGSREDRWCARAATSLAAAWADQGRRVFLADLDLTTPVLHEVLGVANDEGVSDAFLYGASVRRVATGVEDGRYFFAPAGTAVADPGSVAASMRWDPVLEGFRTARADVLILVPSDQDGAARMLERATDVVVLARPDEVELDPTGGISDHVRAVYGPPGKAAGAAAAPMSAVAGVPSPAGGGLVVPPLPPGRRPAGSPPPSATRGRPPRPAPRSRMGALLILLLVVLVGAAAAWWFGLVALPGLPSPPTAEAAPVTGSRPRSTAFQLAEAEDAAAARASELSALNVPAYVLGVSAAPGEPRHRVYAGAFGDATEAA